MKDVTQNPHQQHRVGTAYLANISEHMVEKGRKQREAKEEGIKKGTTLTKAKINPKFLVRGNISSNSLIVGYIYEC